MTLKVEYYTAPWCIPCKTFGPIMEDVFAGETGEHVRLEKIDVQDHPERLPSDVLGIPTVIAYVDDKEIGRFSGAKNKVSLISWLMNTYADFEGI